MNQTFDLSRFGKLLKSDLRLNKSHYLKLSLGIISGFVFFSAIISFFAHNALSDISVGTMQVVLDGEIVPTTIQSEINRFSGFYAVAAIFVASLVLTVIGSLTFNSLSDKKSRISTIMVPASMAEKYWLRVLIYFFGGSAMIFIGWLVGFLIAKISFGANSFIESLFGAVIDEDLALVRELVAVFVIYAYLGQAIYVFGSALWPKLSWLKTWLVLTGLQWIGSLALIGFSFSGYDFGFMSGMWMKNTDFLLTCICVCSVLIIALWTAAWFRFRNTQIVQLFMRK